MTELNAHLVDALLKQQDDEFQMNYSEASPLLHSVITETSEQELFSAGLRELGSGDPRKRILGIRLIRELKGYQEQVKAALIDLIGREGDAAVFIWIVSAFGFIKTDDRVAEWLRNKAADDDPNMRYAIATALANHAGTKLPDESLDVLVTLAHDDDAEVRFSAVFELGSWWLCNRDPRIETELVRAAREDDEPEVSIAAQYALAGRSP